MTASARGPQRLAFAATESRETGRSHVALSGDLDLLGVPMLEAVLERAEAGSPDEVVIDLAGVSFIDAAGLACLLAAHARGRASGWIITFINPSTSVRRLFELCRLGRMFDAPPPPGV